VRDEGLPVAGCYAVVAEARRNGHSFPSRAAEDVALLERFNITLGQSSLQSFVVW
jgi:hypothetical protein